MYHCPFQGKSLVDDVGEVGFVLICTSLVMVRRVSLSHVFMTLRIRFLLI